MYLCTCIPVYLCTSYRVKGKKKEEREEEPAEEEVAGLDGGESRAEQEARGDGKEVEFHGRNCNADWDVGILFARIEPAHWEIYTFIIVRKNARGPACFNIQYVCSSKRFGVIGIIVMIIQSQISAVW